ncbi:MAG: hypothetical protein ABFD83_11285 [Armatimonadota bacterium]
MAVEIGEFTRACAMGAASISDFAKTKTAVLKLSAQTQNGIADAGLLHKAAALFDIETDGRDDCTVASALAGFFMSQFSWSSQPSAILHLAPAKLRQHWKSLGIEPSGIDSVVVESLANTGDPAKTCMKCGIADGWIGSLIATIASDILNGSPKPFVAHIDPGKKIECKSFTDFMKNTEFGGPGNLSTDLRLIAGFSNESIAHMLGGRFRAGLKVLSDAITDGRIRGIACVFGCSQGDNSLADIANELIKRNVLVLNIGCSVVDLAKAGLLLPDAAAERAGETLAEMCEMIGMPPVLQMGSCYESARILFLANELLALGGLGEDFSDMPVAVYCSGIEGRSAAIAGCYAASGLFTVTGKSDLSTFRFPLSTIDDPVDAIITHIESKRDNLKINTQRERKLLDMKERRELV